MEIELKLALHSRHTMRIRRHPLLNAIKPEQRSLLSIYFDTPKLDLMRRGIALRVRRVDDDWIQTLKAEAQSVGALSSRPEWEMAIADGNHPDFSGLPQTALDLLTGIKLKHIAPVFTTEFVRTTWQIHNHTAHAEVALDIGKINAGKDSRDICEVEIELKSGAAEFLFDAATQLLTQVPLHIEPRSKAERGYILSGAITATPVKSIYPPIHPDQTASAAWNAIMQAALVQLVSNVPGFLESPHDTEYLHQLRIALRRLCTGLLLAESLDQTSPTWEQSLRALMHTLNPARDWDVFLLETLPRVLTTLQHASKPTVEETILTLLGDSAAHSRQQAQALLLNSVFTQLVLDIGRSLLATTDNTQKMDARSWAKTVLEKRWHTLRKHCRGFAKLNSTERHQARIAAKKMRYAADAFAPLYGKRSKHFIIALASLQEELGRANDGYIGTQLLQALPKKSVAISFALGRIHGALESEAVQHATLSSTSWRQLSRAKLFWH